MRFLRYIFVLCGILTLVVIIVSGIIYYLIANSLPDYSLQLKSNKISDNTEIIRDSYAIPHIYGTSDADVFFALGYAHAQDRLWQMVVKRRTVQGTLSELFGGKTVDSDILMRTLNLYELAKIASNSLSQESQKVLEAYSNGVNMHLNSIVKKGLGRGSPEFFLFPPKISPWKPYDSIAILKLLAFQSTDKALQEVIKTRLLMSNISAERLNDLFSEPPLITFQESETSQFFLKDWDWYDKDKQKTLIQDDVASILLDLSTTAEKISASNIFAVMPKRSATNNTLAASDPHTELSAPSEYYLANLNLKNGPVIGATLPGIPAILIGKSKKIGWGLSNAFIDDQDLYIEKLNPENPKQYLTESGPLNFIEKREIIKIKGGNSLTIRIRSTKNGPILPKTAFGIKEITPDDHEISLSWTGFEKNDKSLESLISLTQAENINDAHENFHSYIAPGRNLMLVDKNNIMMKTIGKVPKRSSSNSAKGKFPSLGWQEKNSWQGFFPFQNNPIIKNPESGVIINTNNKITDQSFPNHISFDWGDSQRIIRVKDLIRKRRFHTVESFVGIQTDAISISARILLPLLAKNLWFHENSNTESDFNQLKIRALKLLSEWNGDMNKNNSEPLLYTAWVRAFQNLITSDNLGVKPNETSTIRPLFLERVLRNVNGAEEWCDIQQTEIIETCNDISSRSLDMALRHLKTQFGPDISGWRWGDAHTAFHRSNTLGKIPFLSFFANIIHETSGGDNTILMTRMSASFKNPYMATYGSAVRAIYDFSEANKSIFILSTGQSGHILSRHYDDQSLIWQQQQYLPMIDNKNLISGGSMGYTTISPIEKSETN